MMTGKLKFKTTKHCANVLICMSILLSGCADCDYLNMDDQEFHMTNSNALFQEPNILSENDAFLIAGNALKRIQSSRNSDERSYDLEYILRNSVTRTTDIDTLAYVFNMKEDMGFAIIARKYCENPVLAYSETGHFDQTYSSVKDCFVDPLVDYLAEGYYPGVPCPPIGNQTFISMCTPILGKSLGQWEPFNKYVSYDHPGFPVGCVAVATAQIALHSADTLADFHGRTVYLESIRNGLKFRASSSTSGVPSYKNRFGPDYSYEESLDSLGKFLYLLSCDLNTRYDESHNPDGTISRSSVAHSGNSLTLLRRLGFEAKSNYIEFDAQEAATLLAAQCLVYIDGRNIKNTVFGHGFIADGYEKTIYVDGSGEAIYLHIDWGWEGTSNGYFKGEVFESAWGNYKPTKMFAIKSHDYYYLWPPMAGRLNDTMQSIK